MSDWAPAIAGFVIIALAIGVMRFAPHSAWAHELRKPYGVKPTGERGNRTRRDHLRSAGLAILAFVILVTTGVVASSISENALEESQLAAIALTYTFVGFLLGFVAAVSALKSLWKAGRWRVELPDTPEHRRGLADAIDHLLDGGISPEERRDYLEVGYVHPQLEQIRRATLKLANQHRTGIPDDFRVQIKRWTAGIRASAGPRE